ncbi:MAG: phosphate ABC transporter, permease protein PstA [Alcanivoracaceae bacterium]|uniref:phosphate ABC transporter permease PstA n=1 Tax=Alcanivorax sp. MD8A TaxID=1177157 RepID=UPI000C474E14|nr:phosphate ABC transporter permease PstA [Alcanivorax sp. MD8A]MAX56422.1 phosphate ABC transporter, permease protein PstA [Alcanivoracaceae bacterium]MCG8438437.1 phosphate ABC transporter permease PstA [Pseudomonadales bacterium]MED5432885.1 phosphate ABC transporter permease PstA [Pseudomonadota bacterium]MEE2870956.1 phosphate ABC transporter permease PstA [Pseudomonadota bacterium]PNE01191.1 phosphate ABC transporter permease [Alcanivorax sp. MD8A]|tara:strand:- start:2911 stop:4179 length:1269 start_codon:yes stop_codon:yes gene_type:complete
MSKTTEQVRKSLGKRYRAEKRFKAYGVSAIGFGLLALVLLFTDIIGKGHSAFFETYVKMEVIFDQDTLDISDFRDEEQLNFANYDGVIRNALREEFPSASGRQERRELYSLISTGAGYELRDMLKEDPSLMGQSVTLWLLADDDVDVYVKSAQDDRLESRLSDNQKSWIESLEAQDRVELQWNQSLFTHGDSREPELAGIWGAVTGSFFTMLVTLLLSFPIGVAAAIYLEEFAPKNKFTDFIEVNINNLAAVPSIIFGLLGLAVIIGLFGLPRSVPVVGGIVLTLMTLPTIIISSRAAIKAVPPSIREAAMGLGASKMQVVLHHVLPLALPGMLTGAIIGMAQALGETAPLLMIGMVAFIVDVPGGPLDPSTVLPVQIYLWADSPEQSFVALTSAAIMVLLSFLIAMNTLAVFLRKRLERRW